MQWNAEGVTNKQTYLQHFLNEDNITICCIQETRLQPNNSFKVLCYSDHNTHGWLRVLNLKKKDFNMNLYSPNDTAMSLNAIPAVEDHYLVVGDFNSHSQGWGYDHIVKRGEEVENWQDDHKLNLINKPEDQPALKTRHYASLRAQWSPHPSHSWSKPPLCNLYNRDDKQRSFFKQRNTSASQIIPWRRV